MDHVIEARGVKKVYHTTKVPVYALNGVDLNIERGEFTAIVGPSGSGKTTFLNNIGGLDKPSEGSIKVGGREVTQLSDNQMITFRQQNIGFVFQSFNLIPVLTAAENTEFVMLLQGRSRQERQERVHQLLEEVGLGDRLNSKPNELSGGQQQRVAVARALASKPEFVLADEPTASLDTHSATNLLDIMAKLNKDENMTFIFSTHDDRVIQRARRVVTLEDGKVVKDFYQHEAEVNQ